MKEKCFYPIRYAFIHSDLCPLKCNNLSHLNACEGSYCSGEDGGVMSALCCGTALLWICEVLKSRLATPASCFCRFAFGAKRTRSSKLWWQRNKQKQSKNRQNRLLGELTGGLIVQQVLDVWNVVWTPSPQLRGLLWTIHANTQRNNIIYIIITAK